MSGLRQIPREWFHKGMNKMVKDGAYNTHIKRIECCGSDPELFGGQKQSGFFLQGVWQFRCACGNKGGEDITPNGAAAYWNKARK